MAEKFLALADKVEATGNKALAAWYRCQAARVAAGLKVVPFKTAKPWDVRGMSGK